MHAVARGVVASRDDNKIVLRVRVKRSAAFHGHLILCSCPVNDAKPRIASEFQPVTAARLWRTRTGYAAILRPTLSSAREIDLAAE